MPRCSHFRLDHDHDHLHLFGGARRPSQAFCGAGIVRVDPDGIDHRAESFAATIIGGFGDVAGAIIGASRSASSKPLARPMSRFPTRRLRLPRAGAFPGVPAARHLRRTRPRRKHERPSDNMPMTVSAVRAKPMLLRHLPYFLGAAVLVALTATMQFDGYVHNILMQATTFAIAVFGLSVVLACAARSIWRRRRFLPRCLCGRHRYFGLSCQLLALSDRRVRDRAVGRRVARHVDAKTWRALSGDVTISFQQIVTLIMINTIWLTHGPDGVPRIGRRICSVLAIVSGFLRRDAGGGGLLCLASVGHKTGPRDAGGARQ